MAAWRAHPHNMCASGRLECAVTKLLYHPCFQDSNLLLPAHDCARIFGSHVSWVSKRDANHVRPDSIFPALQPRATHSSAFIVVDSSFPPKALEHISCPLKAKADAVIWSRIAFHRHHETTGCLSIVAMKLETTPLTKSGTRSVSSEQKWGIEGAIWRVENPKELPKDPCSHCLIHIWAKCKAATCNLQTQEIKDLTCLDAPPLSTHYAAFGTHVGTQAATKGCLWSFSSQRYLVCI